jgi:hypothetical protein
MSIHEDNSTRCAFFFADGRRCQLPSAPDDMGLCYFHSHKYRNEIYSEQSRKLISDLLNHDVLTASDLTAGLVVLFRATAMGHIKPKTAYALTYLGQLLHQTQREAKQEFRDAFRTPWKEIVEESPIYNLPDPPEEQPAPAPSTSSTSAPNEPAADSNNLDTAPETSQPDPIPHKIM